MVSVMPAKALVDNPFPLERPMGALPAVRA